MMKTSPCQAMKLATHPRRLVPLVAASCALGPFGQGSPKQVCLGLARVLPQALSPGDLPLALLKPHHVSQWNWPLVVLGFASCCLLRLAVCGWFGKRPTWRGRSPNDTSPCQAMELATRGAWFRLLPPLALWAVWAKEPQASLFGCGLSLSAATSPSFRRFAT